ncbi:MAG: lytic transglycosylase domain-containing protein, partial [Gammaproteobacteria bacterium]
AKRYGVANRRDPVANLRGGTAYLRDLLNLFDDNLVLALAAYNAGENTVISYGRKIPPYKETQRYIAKVLDYYRKYRTDLR